MVRMVRMVRSLADRNFQLRHYVPGGQQGREGAGAGKAEDAADEAPAPSTTWGVNDDDDDTVSEGPATKRKGAGRKARG